MCGRFFIYSTLSTKYVEIYSKVKQIFHQMLTFKPDGAVIYDNSKLVVATIRVNGRAIFSWERLE